MARRQQSYAELEASRAELGRLRELWGREQADYALELLTSGRTQTFLAGALEALEGNTEPALQPRLRELYSTLKDDRRADPGGIVATAVLRAMRGLATGEDIGLLEEAVGSRDGNRAAAALVALDSIAPELSVYHAALLAAREPGSEDSPEPPDGQGEPVVSAVRVLAANGQWACLLLLLERRSYAAAHAEALRGLTDVDLKFVYGATRRSLRDPALQEAALDLLLAHRDAAGAAPLLADFLNDCDEPDAYAYAATSIVAGRKAEHLAAFYEQARSEQRPLCVEAALQALEYDPSSEGRELASVLEKRISPRR